MGILAGLTAALAWTLASSLWRSLSTSLTALQLNGLKNAIACALLLPVLVAIPWGNHPQVWMLLLLSGVVGIAIGDSFYLAALRRLGTRRTLTVEALAPLGAAISSLLWMGEPVSVGLWAGAGLVSASVVIVANQRPPECSQTKDRKRSSQLLGLGLALLAVACGVGGAALSRSVLINTPVPPLQSAAVRLLGGLMALLPWLNWRWPCPWTTTRPLGPRPHQQRTLTVITATMLGTNLGILLQQITLQQLPLAVAITMLSTAPVMALLLAQREGDHPQLPGIAASLLALGGVSLAMFN